MLLELITEHVVALACLHVNLEHVCSEHTHNTMYLPALPYPAPPFTVTSPIPSPCHPATLCRVVSGTSPPMAAPAAPLPPTHFALSRTVMRMRP